jgi:Carbohydrate family 9 binding domain-like
MRSLALLALAVGAAGAEDSYDIKVYPCPTAAQAIVVDGALDEPAWEAAPLVTGFTWYNKPDLLPVQTFFRVLHDAKALYFGVVCDEPNLGTLAPVRQARDTHAVFDGETIEVFIDPRHDGNYYQFAVSAAGSMWDSRASDTSWNAEVTATTRLDPAAKQWSLEFRVPWEALGVRPTPGTVVGFNVCRDRYLGSDREWGNWSQTQANFHDPDRFAHLVLAATPEQLAQLAPEFRRGERRGRLVIYSSEGFANTSYLTLARASLTKLADELSALERVAGEQADPATRSELGTRLRAYREETAPFREQAAAGAGMDAAAWMRIDLRVQQLSADLGQVLWEARLAALLSGI